MKKFLKVIAILFVVLVVGGVSVAAYTIYQGNKLDEESRSYAENILPRMLNNINQETFLSYLDEDVKKQMKPSEAEKIISLYQKLGKFKAMTALKGDANISLEEKKVTAFYTAQLEFEQGPAYLRLDLIRKNGAWAVTSVAIE